ncbi:MAG: DUF2723 domain-containing protein [Prevotellaceae bacterium]|jgi:hypothetical protein|nr:DUF2723 domain-containing protein [Prevotellaceae bacterium]
MKSFRFVNNIAGWVCFAIAAAAYLLTIEPTTSLWDCGEFIATSYKMEVGHPPGNSMFMLIARFFTLFTASPQHVAVLVNIMSALCSAFCILFLFWSITHLARRIYAADNAALTANETIAIIGAGFVGALAYTFSDTFWFSAVEGEVYAMSSLFTALVFWAILKWEEEADEKYANRWLILLAYLMGVSIGVHLLNLLVLPAIIFVYYFKKYPVSKKGVLATLSISALILVLAVFVIIPGLPQLAKAFELLFVNGLGAPFNSGLIFYAFFTVTILSLSIYYTLNPRNKAIVYGIVALFAILVCVLIYALVQSILPVFSTLLFVAVCVVIMRYAKKYRVFANTVLLCTTVFILGYFSLATVVIRSAANPPVNENWPDNVFSLISYIGREQYGDRPLISGPSFASPVQYTSKGEPVIKKSTSYFKDKKDGKDYYKNQQVFAGYEYDPDYDMFFPRLYSRQPASHIEEYAEWTGMKIPRGQNRRYAADPNWKGPKGIDNLKFMISYQFDWMYWRYFMWNYVGRQNDIQGHGSGFEGNWISGIPAFDDLRLGIKTDDLPDYLKENKGYNRYFLLPFILGLFGLFFQLAKDKKNFTVVFLLFIMTGIAIAFYLNMPPVQPRERDYVFAGSTYAFAIWIGVGVLSVYEFLRKRVKVQGKVIPVAASALCMFVPVLMATQNWDDHDRSNRYTARDIAHNYLTSCEKNAILVTFGDNDTFPLWYLQEVEEKRTDVRVMNTSLLGGDWYIDQMKYKVYDSDPVPFSLSHEHYQSGTNDMLFVLERIQNPLTAKQIINFITNPQAKIQGETYVPTRTIAVPVDKDAALRNGIVAARDSSRMVDTVYLKMSSGKQNLIKAEMMIIDLFANYKWDRPLYFTSSFGDIELGQKDYYQFDGFIYKFVPIYTPDKGTSIDIGMVNTDVLYDNLMNKYRWGNMNEQGVLIDYHNMVAIAMSQNVRGQFSRLAKALLSEGKTKKAVEALDHCMELTPRNPFFYNISVPQQEFAVMEIIDCYYRANEIEKARKLFDDFTAETSKCLRFFMNMKNSGSQELELNIRYLQQMMRTASAYGDEERVQKLNNLVTGYMNLYKEGV